MTLTWPMVHLCNPRGHTLKTVAHLLGRQADKGCLGGGRLDTLRARRAGRIAARPGGQRRQGRVAGGRLAAGLHGGVCTAGRRGLVRQVVRLALRDGPCALRPCGMQYLYCIMSSQLPSSLTARQCLCSREPLPFTLELLSGCGSQGLHDNGGMCKLCRFTCPAFLNYY